MEKKITIQDLIKIDDNTFEIPQQYRSDMRVPARVFANDALMRDILEDRSLDQLANIATLPGIQKYAFAMPDIHQGYGFPIGGVAAMAIDQGGVISPGGIGYDICCGMRLLVSNISADDLKLVIDELATQLFRAIPSGVGAGGKLKLTPPELDSVLEKGAQYLVNLGYGTEEDLEFCEERGCMTVADSAKISDRAKKRGADQLGTLGSGNHFLEVQRIEEIYDEAAACAFGLALGGTTVMIHCGSRGLGHQTCTDYVHIMMPKLAEWGIQLPDRELACAPFNLQEGQDYFAAMAASANFAWANRHLIGHRVREVWQSILGSNASLRTVYDVAHNIGKREVHIINGKPTQVIMHRKGATRAFPPGHPEIPAAYQKVGQPVLIPGTMGTSSYILAGTQEGMETAFGTSCHGAGRRLSRMKAKKTIRGSELRKELETRGIVIRCESNAGLAEEAPIAYKDVDNVVRVVANAGLAKIVARVVPIAVIKGE